MKDNFDVENYIDKCIEENYTAPALICERASKRLEEVETELTDLEELRKEKELLIAVLKSYNKYDNKSKKKVYINTELETEIKNIPTDKDLISEIIQVVSDLNKDQILTREIIEGVEYRDKDPSNVYIAIKSLFENGILIRNENRTISRGNNWKG